MRFMMQLKSMAFAGLVTGLAAVLALMLLWMLSDIYLKGVGHLSWSFIIDSPSQAGRAGGIASILVSTLLIVGIAMLVALPLGLMVAVWLSEYLQQQTVFSQFIRLSLDVMAGIPSIVYGLFGNAFFSQFLGLGFSILSGGLTLACMILPVFIRSCEAGFSMVNHDWRKSALALGFTRFSSVRYIILPAAMPAVVAGFVLSFGRATAETAVLIFTSGYVDRMPSSWLDSGRSLTVHIYDLSMNVGGGDGAAYASALVLIMLIVVLNAAVQYLANSYLRRNLLL